MKKRKNENNFFKNLKQKKDYTLKSLEDVNCFLCNLNKTVKSVKIFKWLK